MLTSFSLTQKEQGKVGDVLFQLGMYWRIVYGFLRLILASVLLRKIGTPVSQLVYSLAHREQAEDPGDLFLHFFNSILGHIPYSITYFLVFYLIFWGIVDIVLSISLLKHQLWAFSLSIYLIGVFVVYEIYRYFHTHSLTLLFIIFVDIVLMFLIRNEYTNLKARIIS